MGEGGRGRREKERKGREGRKETRRTSEIFGKLQLSCMVYVIQEILIKSAKCTLLLW